MSYYLSCQWETFFLQTAKPNSTPTPSNLVMMYCEFGYEELTSLLTTSLWQRSMDQVPWMHICVAKESNWKDWQDRLLTEAQVPSALQALFWKLSSLPLPAGQGNVCVVPTVVAGQSPSFGHVWYRLRRVHVNVLFDVSRSMAQSYRKVRE